MSDSNNLNSKQPSFESRIIPIPTRRIFLFRSMAGAAAVAYATRNAWAIESTAAVCSLTHEQEIGPYYLDLEKIRQDITEGKPGLPLKLRVTVMDANHCQPIQNAAIDIWHCDALGIYSGFTTDNPDQGPGGPGGMPPPDGPFPGGPPPGPPPAGFGGPPQLSLRTFRRRKPDDTTFLRGVQLTDEKGIAEFTTIYPGWYVGRDTHIHLRVHLGGKTKETIYRGGHVSYTGQLFFADDVSDKVAKLAPYAEHQAPRTLQKEDHVFTVGHGSDSIVTLTQLNPNSLEAGFLATAVIAINPNAVSKERRLNRRRSDNPDDGPPDFPPGPPPDGPPGGPPGASPSR